MTDTDKATIEQLQNEVERLKSKNSELLGELKAAKAVRGPTQEQIETLKVDKEALQTELKELKTKDAWESLYQAAGIITGMSKFFRSEFEEAGLDIGFDDEGVAVIMDKEGHPLPETKSLGDGFERETGQMLRPSNPTHISQLVEPIRQRFPNMWPIPRGGGAPGNNGHNAPALVREKKSKPEENRPKFGIR